uniref:Uncharacterized protein n=1 Tax=Trichogramma kaykai TaxID=54128 RepID=A0ABD2X3N9_9HYME
MSETKQKLCMLMVDGVLNEIYVDDIMKKIPLDLHFFARAGRVRVIVIGRGVECELCAAARLHNKVHEQEESKKNLPQIMSSHTRHSHTHTHTYTHTALYTSYPGCARRAWTYCRSTSTARRPVYRRPNFMRESLKSFTSRRCSSEIKAWRWRLTKCALKCKSHFYFSRNASIAINSIRQFTARA